MQGQLHMKDNRQAQLVIQNQIIAGVYSFPEEIFRNRLRFQMVPSQPHDLIRFQRVMTVFKGRFICKNQQCLQQIREGDNKKPPKNDDWDTDGQKQNAKQTQEDNLSWLKWWKKEYQIIASVNRSQQQVQQQEKNNKKQNKIDLKKQRNQSKQQNVHQNRKEQTKETRIQKRPQQAKQNTRWSSSLTYVKFYYYAYPKPLNRLLHVYKNQQKTKCEIYFYVELLGQKCIKCQSPEYCYPFFGKTELKRMRKNFSSFILNTIYGRPILKYKPCRLKRLVGHKSESCQACELGECGIRSF